MFEISSFDNAMIGLACITLKEIISQTDSCLVSLSSKTYVFEDKLTKYESV